MKNKHLLVVFDTAIEFFTVTGSALFLAGIVRCPTDAKYVSMILFVALYVLLARGREAQARRWLSLFFWAGACAFFWSLLVREDGWLLHWLLGTPSASGALQPDVQYVCAYGLSACVLMAARTLGFYRIGS